MKINHTLYYVDDDPEDISLFTDALSELGSGIKLITFSSGKQFLDSLQREVARPSLLMLDINMPGMNGIHVLREMKNSEELKDVPVVMFSTADDQNVVDECIGHGADMFITKPRSFEGLKKSISHVLSTDFNFESISSKLHLSF